MKNISSLSLKKISDWICIFFEGMIPVQILLEIEGKLLDQNVTETVFELKHVDGTNNWSQPDNPLLQFWDHRNDPPSAGQNEPMLNRVKYSVVSASMGWLGENLDGTKNWS